jgi:hypothetical protein
MMADEEFDELYELWMEGAERAWCGDYEPEGDFGGEPEHGNANP